AAAAEGNDERGNVLAIEIHGVVETCVQDGRRVAEIFSGPEDSNGIGGLSLVTGGHIGDLLIDVYEPEKRDEQEDAEKEAQKCPTGGARASAQVGGRDDHED